jgi:hypothetical protein
MVSLNIGELNLDNHSESTWFTLLSSDGRRAYYSSTSSLLDHLYRSVLVAEESAVDIDSE